MSAGVVRHDYPLNDDDLTSCCGRRRDELPLGDAKTTNAADVTCDGKFTPARSAHEVHPSTEGSYNEAPSLDEAMRYHLARTLALDPEVSSSSMGREWVERIHLMLAEREIACLLLALHKGLSGQAAVDYAHNYNIADDNEVIYDLAVVNGIELDQIRPYALRKADQ